MRHRTAGDFAIKRALCKPSAAPSRMAAPSFDWLCRARPALPPAPAASPQTAAGGRPGDPDHEARETVAAELQKWAQEEAQRREATKRQALAYATGGGRHEAAQTAAVRTEVLLSGVCGPLHSSGSSGGAHGRQASLGCRKMPQSCTSDGQLHGPPCLPRPVSIGCPNRLPGGLPRCADTLAGKEASAARRCLALLQQAAAQPGFLPPAPGSGRGASAGGSHQQQLNLVDTLAALRWELPLLTDVIGRSACREAHARSLSQDLAWSR